MTNTDSALTRLLPGVVVAWPAQPDPTQPWLTPAPTKRTVREVQGRTVSFTDGTRLTLPPDPQLRLGTTPDGSAETLTLGVPPYPSLVLTLVDPLHRTPVLSVEALRRRCAAGAWIEIIRNDKAPALRGKVRWAVGMLSIEGHPAIVFADRSALPLPKDPERSLRFRNDGPNGNRVDWQVKEGGWVNGFAYYGVEIRFRTDLPAPVRR